MSDEPFDVAIEMLGHISDLLIGAIEKDPPRVIDYLTEAAQTHCKRAFDATISDDERWPPILTATLLQAAAAAVANGAEFVGPTDE